tara:strand:+ start:69 stop:644 length:576 start_codon:yes stop_codon:yes gene_type:complete
MIKDSEIIVIDNVIDPDYQEQIRSILLGEVNYGDYEFPWYYTKDITKSDLPNSQKRPAFSHLYVKSYGQVVSEFHNIFIDLITVCCHRLEMTEVNVIQGNSFLQLPLTTKRGKVDTPHIDTNEKNFVMLYYVCDSDGDTIIYNEKVESEKYTVKESVTPKQGRVVLFDGGLFHTAEQPISNTRCVVNYNLV